ncbi:MAG: hypothetical protein H3C30_03120 [Candidatus Hydrogenedentes bacterium]|nr:hypothetical protein [Candidatus Hydrogenedentota bacterium]
MYAGESKGQRYPTMQAGIEPLVDENTLQPTGASFGVYSFNPNIHQIYPEYLTDPAVLVCPSNSHIKVDDLKNARGDWMVPYAVDDGTGQATLGKGIHLVMNSYMYVGWVFDRCAPTNSQMPLMPFTQERGPAQYWKTTASAIMSMRMGNLGTRDADITDSNIYPMFGRVAPDGNGGGGTIYRLREGVERFLITDINNPGASAQAQSNVWIAFDLIAKGADKVQYFSHVPGGSNVLYLDGHVEFLRYAQDGPQPVNAGMARAITAMPHALEF